MERPGSVGLTPGHYSFAAELWEHDGEGAWHFISLPEAEADEIEEIYGAKAGGFGSVRVAVTVGATSWSTSIFPDRKRGTYVLPVKKAVRSAERLTAGTTVKVALEVIQ
jgi:hypothetical protein